MAKAQEEDDLYAQLYGENLEEPVKEDETTPAAVEPVEDVQIKEVENIPEVTNEASPSKANDDGEEDDDFDIILNNQEENEDDDLDIVLNDDSSAKPPNTVGKAGPAAAANNQFKWTRPGTNDAQLGAQIPGMGGTAQKPILSAAAAVHAHPNQRPIWMPYVPPPEYEDAALPSKAKPGQAIRLPGQTRVSPEEYKEFLSLGHGELFNIDWDRVIDTPWRAPDAKVSDYFNFDLNEASWRDYCRQIQQYRLEFTMQSQIDTVRHNVQQIDSDLPPELAAAFQAQNSRMYPSEEKQAFSKPGSGVIQPLSSAQLDLIKKQKTTSFAGGRGRGRGRSFMRFPRREEVSPTQSSRAPSYAQVLTGGDNNHGTHKQNYNDSKRPRYDSPPDRRTSGSYQHREYR